MKVILTYLFGVIMILAGINHFVTPGIYLPFIPDFLPVLVVNLLAGIVELVLGIGVFIPRFRRAAGLGILILMLMFLPLHFLDVFKDNPAIGSHTAAVIRLPLQFILILWAWYISKRDATIVV